MVEGIQIPIVESREIIADRQLNIRDDCESQHTNNNNCDVDLISRIMFYQLDVGTAG